MIRLVRANGKPRRLSGPEIHALTQDRVAQWRIDRKRRRFGLFLFKACAVVIAALGVWWLNVEARAEVGLAVTAALLAIGIWLAVQEGR